MGSNNEKPGLYFNNFEEWQYKEKLEQEREDVGRKSNESDYTIVISTVSTDSGELVEKPEIGLVPNYTGFNDDRW